MNLAVKLPGPAGVSGACVPAPYSLCWRCRVQEGTPAPQPPVQGAVPLHCCYAWVPSSVPATHEQPVGWVVLATCDALGRRLRPTIVPLHAAEPQTPEAAAATSSAAATTAQAATPGLALSPLGPYDALLAPFTPDWTFYGDAAGGEMAGAELLGAAAAAPDSARAQQARRLGAGRNVEGEVCAVVLEEALKVGGADAFADWECMQVMPCSLRPAFGSSNHGKRQILG